MTEVTNLSVYEMSAMLSRREISSVDLTKQLIAAIEAKNPRFQAFLTPTFELALQQAVAADKRIAAGQRASPIDGVAIALKDAYDTKGIRTTVGSGLFKNRIPAQDAAIWEKLRDAGAVLLGKLECTEFCLGGPSFDAAFPFALNPHDSQRYSGGSSSGAGAALATGMCPAAMGSDTGGSIRIPAAFCGVAGIKPTYGLVSMRGLFPLSGSLDHAGPMARTSRDCAMLLDVIAGYDPDDSTSSPRQIDPVTPSLKEDCYGMVIGYVTNFATAEGVSAESRQACERALDVYRSLGAEIRPVTMPDLWDYTIANTTIMTAEGFAIHSDRMRQHMSEISYLTRHRIALGAFISGEAYIKAQKARRKLTEDTRQIMEVNGLDLLCYPAMLGDPPKLEDMTPYYYLDLPLITAPANLTGMPASSVRAGFSEANMPMAFQLSGRHFDDGKVLQVAHAYEIATPDFSKIVE